MEKGLIYLLLGVGYLLYKGYMKKKELDEQKKYAPPQEPSTTTPPEKENKSDTNFKELFGELFSEVEEPKKKSVPKPQTSSEPVIEKTEPKQNFNFEENAHQAQMPEKAKAAKEKRKIKQTKKAKTVGTKRKSNKVLGASPREAYKHHILFQRKFT